MSGTDATPVAVVTGGGRGIGRATSVRLASDGFRVWVADLDPAAADEVADEIGSKGGVADGLLLDVADVRSVASVFGRISREGPIDVLVNNAAITSTHPFDQVPPDVWERTFRVNVFGMYECIRAALPGLRQASPPARIINMASGAGRTAGVYTVAYHASKAAVISLTRTAASALGPGILVNCVSPGVVDTPMWEGIDEGLEELGVPDEARFAHRSTALPLGRPATADDVVGVIAFLASDDARFVTGAELNVSGGSVLD